MKRFLLFLTFPALLYALSACRNETSSDNRPVVTDTIPDLVMQVQQCARLYTTEYKIRKIITHDDVVRLKGSLLSKDFDITLPMGERKIAIPMTATLKAYIDFSDFSEENVERDGERITIVLPDPQVALTSSKIDQKAVREYVGLTRSHFTDREMSNYEQQGRQAILNSIPQTGIIESARANAARVLVPMLVEMGYREQDVTIAFRKNLDIGKLLINSNPEKP